ncbi:MAG: hypothetical protein ISS70_25175 [Phycisphaerae bacterium]|nr:hypothetical protein [Phycisphaerae bacterium]
MVSKQTKKLLAECERVAQQPGNRGPKNIARVADDALGLRIRLSTALVAFKRGDYRTFTENDHPRPVREKGLRRMREQLMERFGSTLEPAVTGCLRILDSLSDGSHAIYDIQGENK